jgi:2,3-bisphosphoglycerate-independent phosphoglycerate mutase
MNKKKVLLVILDGVGCNPAKKNNGIIEARTPNLDDIFANNPHSLLNASGAAVGLPKGQMGNSEVGHLTIGSGCIIKQDLVRINESIKNGTFFKNPVLLNVAKNCKKNNSSLHLIGLVSDGGVHSHIKHLIALIDFCKQQKIHPVLHMITDGRDTSPRCAINFSKQLKEPLKRAQGTIATIAGRFYAMDRDNRWDRIKLYFDTVIGINDNVENSPEQAIEKFYQRENKSDEFINPVILNKNAVLKTNDEIICFNFRSDRSRQVVTSLADKNFSKFKRPFDFKPPNITCMTNYDDSFYYPVVFPSQNPAITLAKILSDNGLKQFHCAETEKFAHVTYFFNGGEQKLHEGEKHTLVPSPQVTTYDKQPQMSAKEVTDNVISACKKNKYSFVVVNLANGDMVGHTAVKNAIIKAVETLDTQIKRMVEVAKKNDYSVIITADHGNCEEYIDPINQKPHTQHTSYPVPIIIIDKNVKDVLSGCGLSSITPTILDILGIKKPQNMDGESLLVY